MKFFRRQQASDVRPPVRAGRHAGPAEDRPATARGLGFDPRRGGRPPERLGDAGLGRRRGGRPWQHPPDRACLHLVGLPDRRVRRAHDGAPGSTGRADRRADRRRGRRAGSPDRADAADQRPPPGRLPRRRRSREGRWDSLIVLGRRSHPHWTNAYSEPPGLRVARRAACPVAIVDLLGHEARGPSAGEWSSA